MEKEKRFEVLESKIRKGDIQTIVVDFTGVAEKLGREKVFSNFIQNDLGAVDWGVAFLWRVPR